MCTPTYLQIQDIHTSSLTLSLSISKPYYTLKLPGPLFSDSHLTLSFSSIKIKIAEVQSFRFILATKYLFRACCPSLNTYHLHISTSFFKLYRQNGQQQGTKFLDNLFLKHLLENEERVFLCNSCLYAYMRERDREGERGRERESTRVLY